MRNLIFGILILFLYTDGRGQTHDFDSLMSALRSRIEIKSDTSSFMRYESGGFRIKFASRSLGLNEKDVFLKHKEGKNIYPLSYSVIYEGRLVTLFSTGRFACYMLPELTPDRKFEKALNTMKFDSHLLLNGQLHAVSGGMLFVYNGKQWLLSPMKYQWEGKTKLYDNETYLVYADCKGEWGGTVYFLDKNSGICHFANACCANTVYEEEGAYMILSSLAHDALRSELQRIEDPALLPVVTDYPSMDQDIMALGIYDTGSSDRRIFSYSWIEVISALPYEGKRLQMITWKGRSFLAEISGNEIIVRDPLFNDEMLTSRTVTTAYGDGLVCVNLAVYAQGLHREESLLLIRKGEVIRINWKQK